MKRTPTAKTPSLVASFTIAGSALFVACGGAGSSDPLGPGSGAVSPDAGSEGSAFDGSSGTFGGPDASSSSDSSTGCHAATPPAVDPAAFTLEPPFAGHYTAYDMGAPSGLPGGGWLTSAFVSPTDPNTLLLSMIEVLVGTERHGQLWSAPLTRDACGHVTGFAGPGVFVREMPDIRALAPGPNGVLFALFAPSNSAVFRIDEIVLGQPAPTYSILLNTVGLDASGFGNNLGHLAFVPPNLQDPQGLRLVAGGAGGANNWWHLTYSPGATSFAITAATGRSVAPSPGHVAYVPRGSPGFTKDSLLAADEWTGSIGVWDVDSSGDPVPGAERRFGSVSGASRVNIHFEPQTGDFIVGFRAAIFQMYVLRGFVPPPPVPPIR